MARTYRDLIVWQKAKSLAVDVYKATEGFPKTEVYGLTSQMRRSAVSVFSNIAEGQGRLTRGEFLQFLGHARGSLLELDGQMELAMALGYMESGSYDQITTEIYRVLGLLNRLIDSLGLKKRPESLKP